MLRRSYLTEVPPPRHPIKAYSRLRVTLKPNRGLGAGLPLWNFRTELERLGFMDIDARPEQNEVVTEVTVAVAFDDSDDMADYIFEAIDVIGYSPDDFSCDIVIVRQGGEPG